MRFGGRASMLVVAALCLSGCGASNPFRPYEYEEDLYLSLDGSATMYVNASLPALNALRGTSFASRLAGSVDRDAIRQYYSSADTRVISVRSSKRNGRLFAHLRIEVGDVSRLSGSAPFAWSTYQFRRDGDLFVYKQTVGPSARNAIEGEGWTGREPVAFRLHLPSKITFHDNGAQLKRGNILVWEQTLADRLNSVPITIEARMETRSILYRTLYLFGATFAVVAVGFVVVIWWIVTRAGKGRGAEPGGAEHV